jgi:hypothetical protein
MLFRKSAIQPGIRRVKDRIKAGEQQLFSRPPKQTTGFGISIEDISVRCAQDHAVGASFKEEPVI